MAKDDDETLGECIAMMRSVTAGAIESAKEALDEMNPPDTADAQAAIVFNFLKALMIMKMSFLRYPQWEGIYEKLIGMLA